MNKTILEALLNVTFTASVHLKGTLTSGSELSHLKKGDIVILNQKISEPLTLFIDQTACFKVWPTTCRKTKGVIVEGGADEKRNLGK